MIRKEFQKIRKCPINWTQEELIMTSVNYNVGDVVKVREDLAPGEYYGGIYLVRDMLQYDKVRISYVYDDKYAVDEDAYVYTDEMLDGLVEREQYELSDLKWGTKLKCTKSPYSFWTVGEIYVMDSTLAIYDNDGERWSNYVILDYLNSADTDYLTFTLCEQYGGKSESININAPDYYTSGIETKDYIRSHNLNFNRGSAVKYATRAGKKHPDKEIEDLKKAINFLQFEIDYLENNK